MGNAELSQSDWLQIKSIVNRLIDVDEHDVEEQVDQLCGANSRIKPKVLELISIHLGFENKTLTPAIPASQVFIKHGELKEGELFSKYSIVKKIGTGGMGQVYLAQRNDEIHQNVAIKILSHHVMDEQIQTRFDTERRILASLDHPHIARLIDAGCEKNTAFYVMEYVEGLPIDTFCQRNKLCLADRLDLFLQVCSAVSYAHRNLIVHRDLKPSNIMVDDRGQVKLLDFGIAKPLKILPGADSVHKTIIGNLALTPQYAAPEQIKGDGINVSCDIYVLGLLLHRLLTNQHAFDFVGKSWGEIEYMICHQLPVPASKSKIKTPEGGEVLSDHWFKALRGDIDAIISHSIRKEPENRYLSVDELILDVKRLQSNDPIQIRSSQGFYRFRKRAKKYLFHITAVSILMLVFIFSFFSIKQQRDIAVEERKRAEVLSEIFTAAFKSADPMKSNGEKVSALDIVHKISTLIADHMLTNPVLSAQLNISIAEVYLNLGEREKASELLSMVGDYYDELSEKDKISYHYGLIKAKIDGADLEELLNDVDLALKKMGAKPRLLYAKAYILRIMTRYVEGRAVMESFFFKLSMDDDLYISSCSLYGYMLLSDDKNEQAKKVLENCLAVVNSSNTTKNLWELSAIDFNLGRLYINTEDYDTAVKHLLKAIDYRKQLPNLNKHEMAEPHVFLSDALLASGFPERALLHAENAYRLRQEHRIDAEFDSDIYLVKPLFRIGKYHYSVGDYVKSKEIFEKVIKTRIAYGAGMAGNTGLHYFKLGETYCKLGALDQAIEVFEKASEIFNLPKYNAMDRVYESEYLKAQCYFDHGEIVKAREFFEVYWDKFQIYHKNQSRLYRKAMALKKMIFQN